MRSASRTLALLGLCLGAGAAARAAEDEPKPAAQAEPKAEAPPAPDAVKRAIYVPDSVKAQIRDELKKEVLEQARSEGWASPGKVPAWLSRLKLHGEVRGRFERILFGRGNANSGEFPDFAAINAGKPYDVNFVDPSNERYLNVDQDRTRPRLRARLGLDAALPSGFTAGVRLASGDSAQPVSAYQTLGGSGGDFSRYQFWIDRAFIKYEPFADRHTGFTVLLGRFENPFFNTELLFNDSVNFDGAALKGVWSLGAVSLFGSAGAFPVYTTSIPFAPEQPSKYPSTNKWLYAAQGGAAISLGARSTLRAAFAFYDFDKVEGRQSQSCDTNLSYVTCETDETRPSFAQKGNTYLALRNPSAAALALEAVSTVSRWQYFGLASRFRELALTARFTTALTDRLVLTADAEGVHNPGFRDWEVDRVALNNRGPLVQGNLLGPLQAGNNGGLVRLAIGTAAQDHQGDFRLALTYRYVESDAALDAFTDADFGLGGTNLKGYSLEASYCVADGVCGVARWFSADEVGGPVMAVDVLQLDLVARF